MNSTDGSDARQMCSKTLIERLPESGNFIIFRFLQLLTDAYRVFNILVGFISTL